MLTVMTMTVIAAALRLVALDRWPPGLYHDEAFNGLDALRVLQGDTPIFFTANNGREPLFIYLQALSVALFGRSPGALRLVSAIVGTLTIPTLYLMGRALFDRRTGVLAAALAVGSVWMVNLSRVGFRAVTLPPIMALALAALWHGLRHRRPWAMLASGALFGLSLYTYLAARFGPVALLFFVIYIALYHRQMLWLRGWALLIVAALLVAAPLGIYLVTHWESTLGRAGQVSIMNPAIHGGNPWSTLARHVVATAGLFFIRGDFNPRHNIPLQPVYDPLMGAAFVVGLGIVLRRARRDPASGLIAIWLGTMLLPTILAEDAPHMLRAVGILPVLLLFPSLGLRALWDEMARRGWGRVAPALVAGLLILSGSAGMVRYTRHLRSEAAYYQFESGATELAAQINRHLGSGWPGHGLVAKDSDVTSERIVWLDPRLWRDWESIRYLTPESEGLYILPDDGAPPALPAGDDLLVVMWAYGDMDALWAALPPERIITVREGAQERGDLDAESRLLYVTVRSRERGTTWHEVGAADIARPAGAVWAGDIRLEQYALEPLTVGGQPALQVSLYWAAGGAVSADYSVFRHVVCGEQIIGQSDGPPAQGYYSADRWRAGDIIEDVRIAPLSEPYDPTACQVRVGFYRWDTGERLEILDGAGYMVADAALTLP